MADGRPFMARTTVRGYLVGEVVSALQKAIRRSDEEQAVYWAVELDQSGMAHYLWSRLLIITSEDVGIAWTEGPSVMRSLFETWQEAKGRRNPHRPERLFVVHAAMALARAPKSRRVDVAVWATYGNAKARLPIPDYALDWHTARGKAMGRGEEHWEKEASRIDQPGELDLTLWDSAYAVCEEEPFEMQWAGPADREPTANPQQELLL